MRAAALLLLLPGCLYVGEVNQAPTASLTITDVPQMLIKGAPLLLTGSMHDPEDGTNLTPIWTVELLGANAGSCDYELS